MRVTKKQIATAQSFDTQALEIAKSEYEAKDTESITGPTVLMETTFGLMTVTPRTRPCKDVLFSVFCRFEDDKQLVRAAKHLGSNPASGKYNFHYTGSGDENNALRSFRMHLQRATVE